MEARDVDEDTTGTTTQHDATACDICRSVLVCVDCREHRVATLVRCVRALNGWPTAELDEADRQHEGRPALVSGDVANCESCGRGWLLSNAEWHAWATWPPVSTEPWTPPCEQFAAKALEFAREATWLSSDPLASAALEAVKVCLDTIAGHRRMPVDPLNILAASLKGREPKTSEEARKRLLCELIERHRDALAPPDGRRPWGSLTTEAPSLLRTIHDSLGDDYKRLTVDHCEQVLRGLLLPSGKGNLAITGAAAHLLLWSMGGDKDKWSEEDYLSVLKEFDQAFSRGRATNKAKAKR